MYKSLILFLRERFPPFLCLGISLILFAAPAVLVGLGTKELISGLVTTFLALLVLRITDDVADMELDAISHPERGLVSGAIDKRKLTAWACLFVLLVFLINYPLRTFLAVTGLCAYYFFYYRFRKRLLPFQPFFVNVIFPAIPIYAALKKGVLPGPDIILLSLFVWTAVAAHDYAHSIIGPGEGRAAASSFQFLLDPRRSSVIACLFFFCSFILGIALWLEGAPGLLFLFALTAASIMILRRCIALLRNPSGTTARGFYVSGFLFFLVPMAAIILERVFYALTGS